MGLEYAWVHIQYTIPLGIGLTLLYRPLFSLLDVYKVVFLVIIAIVSTIPWDSYLIRNRIWSYPPNAVFGPTLFEIPIEEIFFFFIQTYDVSVLWLILNKPTLHTVYLEPGKLSRRLVWIRTAGQLFLVLSIVKGVSLVQGNGTGTYMGLIVVWAAPFLLLLWTLAYQFICSLPISNTLLPIIVSTLYLWIVDTLALKRGTWVIENGTKYDYHLWDGLEIEEAVFFLVTNTLIVLGLLAFEYAIAVLDASCSTLSYGSTLPSPWLLVKALSISNEDYEQSKIVGIRQAVDRLRSKSRSFYIASAAFENRLRIDLIVLYSFCRLADDLVDHASSVAEARAWVHKLRNYLDITTIQLDSKTGIPRQKVYIEENFPKRAHLTLSQIPIQRLSREPLYGLLKGFDLDLQFSGNEQNLSKHWPINSEADLEEYGLYVAGTVAELCLDLVFYHYPQMSTEARPRVKEAAMNMGIGLQIVNIARDIAVDAKLGRIYIPTAWLKDVHLTPESVIKNPQGPSIENLRLRLLNKALSIYEGARGAIEELPREVRGPMRCVVDSYMEIGRTLRRPGFEVLDGRATVTRSRRLWVAWKALYQ